MALKPLGQARLHCDVKVVTGFMGSKVDHCTRAVERGGFLG